MSSGWLGVSYSRPRSEPNSPGYHTRDPVQPNSPASRIRETQPPHHVLVIELIRFFAGTPQPIAGESRFGEYVPKCQTCPSEISRTVFRATRNLCP